MPYLAKIHQMNGRQNSYEVEVELDVRKLMELKTGRLFEFQKNDDKKGYDLVCNKYTVTPTDWNKQKIGYVEIEEVCSWTGSTVPANWYCHSFLARKIYQFDWNKNKWTTEPHNDADSTLYLKVSSDLSGAVCASVRDIMKYGKGKLGKKGLSQLYNDTYLEIGIGHPSVVVGLDRCIEYIVDYLTL